MVAVVGPARCHPPEEGLETAVIVTRLIQDVGGEGAAGFDESDVV
jgi:hypothetical protein